MDKHEIRDRIDYIVMCVSEFARRFKLTNQQAYAYLRRFSGIELIMKHYGIMHTLPLNDAVESLQILCYRKGGRVI